MSFLRSFFAFKSAATWGFALFMVVMTGFAVRGIFSGDAPGRDDRDPAQPAYDWNSGSSGGGHYSSGGSSGGSFSFGK